MIVHLRTSRIFDFQYPIRGGFFATFLANKYFLLLYIIKFLNFLLAGCTCTSTITFASTRSQRYLYLYVYKSVLVLVEVLYPEPQATCTSALLYVKLLVVRTALSVLAATVLFLCLHPLLFNVRFLFSLERGAPRRKGRCDICDVLLISTSTAVCTKRFCTEQSSLLYW